MKSQSRLILFSLAACVTYTLAYYFEWSLFQYHLVENRFYFLWEEASPLGPTILWYGWLASAVLVGAVLALIVPGRWSARLPPDLVWLVPIAVVLAAVLYEMRWFR